MTTRASAPTAMAPRWAASSSAAAMRRMSARTISGGSGDRLGSQRGSAVAASAARARARGEPSAQATISSARSSSSTPCSVTSVRASSAGISVSGSSRASRSQPPSNQADSGDVRVAMTTSARSGSMGRKRWRR